MPNKDIIIKEDDVYIVVAFFEDSTSATISTNLHNAQDDMVCNAQIDALESMILAHALAGVDIKDKKYVEGIKVAMEAIDNNS